MVKEELIEALIDLAIEEDIASGDISTDAIIPVESKAAALMTAKADGVISGLEVIRKVYERFEDDFEWKPFVKDGDKVRKGDTESLSVLRRERRGDIKQGRSYSDRMRFV